MPLKPEQNLPQFQHRRIPRRLFAEVLKGNPVNHANQEIEAVHAALRVAVLESTRVEPELRGGNLEREGAHETGNKGRRPHPIRITVADERRLDVLNVNVQRHPVTPTLVVRVQIKNKTDSALSLVVFVL